MAKLTQPSGDLQVKIREELHEDPKAIPEMVAMLKEWMSKQPHLPEFNDDGRLLTFLRGSKFSLEKAKKKVDMYFSMRAAVPEFFANRDPLSSEIQTVWDEVHIPTLMGLTNEGNRVTWMTNANDTLDITSASAGMKLTLMMGDLRLKMEDVGIAGDVYVFDNSSATPSQFAKFSPTLIKKFLITVQEAYPVRLRQVHIINVSPFADVIFNIVKPFLKDKIKDRIHFHTTKGIESLQKFIPIELIPKEYGGKGDSLKDTSAMWRKTIEENRQWFLDQENVKTDESKRPGKQINYDDLFGAEGSFRKLTID